MRPFPQLASPVHALEHLQAEFPSKVVAWQLLRSMFEYVTTFAWIAADPDARTRRWLKWDYGERVKLGNDLVALGEVDILAEENRERLAGYEPELAAMPPFVNVTREADEAWEEALQALDGYLPEDMRRFRLQYTWIYRGGSRFTHPSSHAVNAFMDRRPDLAVGDETPLEQDLSMIGSAVMALGLAVAATAVPEIGITVDDVHAALS